jgi:hypothetical protein
MCKDKWNYINCEYKRIVDYHKGTGNNTSYLDLSLEKCNKFHLLKLFNGNYYNVIEVFQGERNIHVVMHVKDLLAKGYGTQQSEEQ